MVLTEPHGDGSQASATLLCLGTGERLGEVRSGENDERFGLAGAYSTQLSSEKPRLLAIVIGGKLPDGQAEVRVYEADRMQVAQRILICASSQVIAPSVAFVRDLDDDNWPDIVVGLPETDTGGGAQVGRVMALSSRAGNVLWSHDGHVPFERFGASVLSIPQAATSTADAIIVATRAESTHGPTAVDALYALSSRDGNEQRKWSPHRQDLAFGRSVALWWQGPIDGGYPAMAIGSPSRTFATVTQSVIYIKTSDAPTEFVSRQCDGGDEFGASVAILCDLNGARFVVIGAPGQALSRGEVTIFDFRTGAERFRLSGQEGTYRFGRSVIATKDIDGDEVQDLLIQGYASEGGAVTVEARGSIDPNQSMWTWKSSR
jgi:hypothetical protein